MINTIKHFNEIHVETDYRRVWHGDDEWKPSPNLSARPDILSALCLQNEGMGLEACVRHYVKTAQIKYVRPSKSFYPASFQLIENVGDHCQRSNIGYQASPKGFYRPLKVCSFRKELSKYLKEETLPPQATERSAHAQNLKATLLKSRKCIFKAYISFCTQSYLKLCSHAFLSVLPR